MFSNLALPTLLIASTISLVPNSIIDFHYDLGFSGSS
jgi:hypothetical protein